MTQVQRNEAALHAERAKQQQTPRGAPRSHPAPPNYNDYRSVKHPKHAANAAALLPYRNVAHRHRHLLLLDLDETLVHASVQPVAHDVAFVVDMETHQVPIYVKCRPHAQQFLRHVSRLFEVAVFTASLSKYADQVVQYLDPTGEFITHRLFRDHCTEVDGTYVKDLSLLGRSLERVVLVDNSPVAYLFHPHNAVPILSWFDDSEDRELLKLLPLMESLAQCGNVVDCLSKSKRERLL